MARVRGSVDFENEFVQVVREGRDICMLLERGQAEQPITDVFEQFLANSTGPLRISCVGVNETAGQAALDWFAGEQLDTNGRSLNTIHINSAPGRFDTKTVSGSRVVRECDWHDLQFLLAKSCDPLLDDPGDYQEFCAHGQALVVACNSETPDDEVVELIGDLLDVFDAVWAIVFQEGEGKTNATANLVRGHAASLPPVFIDLKKHSVQDMQASFLANPTDELRQSLQYAESFRELGGAVDSIDAKCARAMRQLEMQQQKVEAPRKASLTDNNVENTDEQIVTLREQTNDRIADIERNVTSRNDRDIQTLGGLSTFLREKVSRIDESSLSRSEGRGMTILKLKPAQIANLNREVSHAMRQRLHDDTVAIGTEVKTLKTGIQQQLHSIVNEPVEVTVPPLQEEQMWQSVENLMDIGRDSRIELKKRGVFDLLTAGRQKIFIIIMMLSLAGRMGMGASGLTSFISNTIGVPEENVTSMATIVLAVLLVTLFIGSAINAAWTWKFERANQTEKEVQKIKETLTSDGERVMSQAQKIKLAQIREHLKDVAKALDRQIDTVTTSHRNQIKTARDDQAMEVDRSRRLLEGRVRDFNDMQRRIEKLRITVRELADVCRRSLKQSVQEAEVAIANPNRGVEASKSVSQTNDAAERETNRPSYKERMAQRAADREAKRNRKRSEDQ